MKPISEIIYSNKQTMADSIELFKTQFSIRHSLFALCYLLIILGCLHRIGLIVDYNPVDHIWSDPQRHWEQGSETLRNDPMAMTDPVMYQLYVGALAKLTFKDPVLVAFYTSLLSLFGPWAWYRFFRELQGDKLLAVAGWALLTWLPSWSSIYSYFMQETLQIPLLGAALYCSWRCRRKQDVASFVVMVALWIAAGLTRGIAIPMAAVACTWLWLIQPDKIKKAIYSLVVMMLVMGPLTYRSYQTMNIIAPHGIGSLVNIYTHSGKKEIQIQYERSGARWGYTFGSPSTGDKPFEPLSDWQSARTGVVRAFIDVDEGKRDWERALNANPVTWENYFWLTQENIIFIFFGSSWPDNNMSRITDVVNHNLRWVWAPLFIICAIFSVIYWRRLGSGKMLTAIIMMWLFIQVLVPISVNEGRYRKPLEGLLVGQSLLLLAARRRRDDQSEHAVEDPKKLYAIVPLTAGTLGLIWLAHSGIKMMNQSSHFNDQGIAFLSDTQAIEQSLGWGELQLDRSVEKKALSVSGQNYPKGLGMHADARVSYRIPSEAKSFYSLYAITDGGLTKGMVRFSIELDGKKVWQSQIVQPGLAQPISIDVQEARVLTLIVDDLGQQDFDHGAWLDAQFSIRAAEPELSAQEARR